MTTPLLPFALALAHAVDPDHDHARMSEAIATVAAEERPLFADDESREKTLSLLVSVAWREGSLGVSVLGDCDEKTKDGVCIAKPHSFCSMQVHDTSGGDASLNEDPEKCIRTGLGMLRTSMRICPEHPLSFYAAGPRGYKTERAQRISRDRVALAQRLRAAAKTAILASEVAQ